MRTDIAIMGTGPAALLLSQSGIESIVVETRSRGYAVARIRAGTLEQSCVGLPRFAGTIAWSRPGGGSRKLHVERHEQTIIRASVAPARYAAAIRQLKRQYSGVVPR